MSRDVLRVPTAQGFVTVRETGLFGAVLVQVGNEAAEQVTGAVLSAGQALTVAGWLALGQGYTLTPTPRGGDDDDAS